MNKNKSVEVVVQHTVRLHETPSLVADLLDRMVEILLPDILEQVGKISSKLYKSSPALLDTLQLLSAVREDLKYADTQLADFYSILAGIQKAELDLITADDQQKDLTEEHAPANMEEMEQLKERLGLGTIDFSANLEPPILEGEINNAD